MPDSNQHLQNGAGAPDAMGRGTDGGAQPASGGLGRQVSLKLAARVALVILLMTSIAYFHVTSMVRERSLGSLEKFATEHAQREQEIFRLAERSHAIIRAEALRLLNSARHRNPETEFNRFMERRPDGTLRSSRRNFDGARDPFAFMGRQANPDRRMQRTVLVLRDLSRQFGLAGRHSFQNVYFTMPENVLVGYWPEFDRWAHDASADLNIPKEEYFAVSTPENNPGRRTVWTGLFYDSPSGTWMMSAETPIDIGGRHVATIGHDITLNELMERSARTGLEGGYNLIFRGDGRLIFDRERIAEIQRLQGVYQIAASGDARLKESFRLVMGRAPGQVIVEDRTNGEYLAVHHLPGPDLYFVSAYPEHLIESAAFGTAQFILLLGLASLLLEVAIFWWVLRRDVTRPLGAFIALTDRVAEGDFAAHADSSRNDEIGVLGRAFNHMAASLAGTTEELKYSEDRFRGIAESTSDWMWETGPDLRFSWVTPNVEKVLGFPPEYYLGKSRNELPPPEDDIEGWRAHIDRLNRHAEIREFRFARTMPDGEKLHLEISEKPIIGTDGKFMGYRGTGRDITLRVRAEEAVARLNEELEERVAARTAELHDAQTELVKNERLATLGRLAATVSHELRNPLGAIATSLAVLDARTRNSGIGAERSLDRMNRSVSRCERIIQEMLDYARTRDVEMAPTEFDTCLAELLADLRVPAGITLRQELKAPGSFVALDADRFRRVAINLFDNACQALEASDGSAAAGGEIRIATHIEKDRLQFEIADNGPGIPDDILASVFEPLYSTKSFGVGLGLPIVKEIVEEHGGRIHIHSGAGSGTRVAIDLPLAAADAAGSLDADSAA